MALTIVWTPMIESLARAEDGVSTVTTSLSTVDEVVVTAEIEEVEVEVMEGVATDESPCSSYRFLSTAFQYPTLALELGHSRCRKHDLILHIGVPT
jgi:hypothetical protein